MNIEMLKNKDFNDVIEKMPCGFFIYTGSTRYFFNLNEEFYKIYGYKSHGVKSPISLAMLLFNVIDNDKERVLQSLITMVNTQRNHMKIVYVIRDITGCLFRIVHEFYRLATAGTNELYYGFVTKSYTEEKKDDEFVDKVYKDSLTKAYNRLYFNEMLKYKNAVSAMAIFDIDDFKKVNDKYGHLVGDVVLQDVVNCIMNKIRTTDSIVRLGGDEFLIIFEDFNPKMLGKKLHDIKRDVMHLKWEKYPALRVTCSFGGIATKDLSDKCLNEMDKLLYKAKLTKNTICIQ